LGYDALRLNSDT